MREKLNENPVAQIAVIGVLVLVVGLFLMKSLGGGEEAETETATAPPAEAAPEAGGEAAPVGGSLEGATPAASAASVSAPSVRPLPDPVEAAYERGATVALLIYRPGAIEDRHVAAATSVLEQMPGVALFTAPAGKISEYAAITGPLGVNQAPALVVISPRGINGGEAAPATVTYGFQGSAEIRQAVIDAGYRGPELTYAPK